MCQCVLRLFAWGNRVKLGWSKVEKIGSEKIHLVYSGWAGPMWGMGSILGGQCSSIEGL